MGHDTGTPYFGNVRATLRQQYRWCRDDAGAEHAEQLLRDVIQLCERLIEHGAGEKRGKSRQGSGKRKGEKL